MYSKTSLAHDSSSSASITEMLGALCDYSLSGVSWKLRALGGLSREGVRRALKKRAYGALLSKLFHDVPSKGCTSRPSSTVTAPPRNKVLMICFDLRVSGCQEEAERLEDQLCRLPAGGASGLKEVDAVLELLVQLAGSAPPPPTSFSRDYMRRKRPVLRRPPLGGYQNEELQRLEARAWSMVCGEEWGSLGDVCGTIGLMDAPPGTGLLALRTSSEVEERFEKETRLSLFGALHHTRTSDLDIKLDLPPVPSNADITGLAIRVPSSLDQSEDEGFQSASNLTPDSQSEASPIPEVDIWEALRFFQPGRRRCWESVGRPPGKRESPFLTEGGREAFDQLYRLWEGEMRVVTTDTSSPVLPIDSQTQLVTDLLNVLVGVASTTFPLNQCVQFDVRPGVCVSGASPDSVSRLLGELAQYGTHYLRLSRFSLPSANKRGLVFQAFTGGLRKYLHYYRACVLSAPPALSLLTISFLFRKVGRQLRYLSELCCVDGPQGVGKATFPVGVKLLSYLYNEAQSNCSNENYPVLLSLLKSCCEPYTRFVSDWVYSGLFKDSYGEFMIQVNEEYLSIRDKSFWVQGYTLISKEVEDSVPVFLRHIAKDVYVCGKTINLLKICCPQHYICWSELPVPRIAVTFSLPEVEQVERDCVVYRARVERIAKHSAISREEQVLRAEQARQELISQVKVSAAKTLESICGHQVSQRLAEEAKKRERFEELKQHLQQEQEWRSTARNKEQEDDFSYARELREREKRLQALEEQLEHRARMELIAKYSHLSEEAARRERRAMWKVQRMRLDEARVQFLMEDKQRMKEMREESLLGHERPPWKSQQPEKLTMKQTQEPRNLGPSDGPSEKHNAKPSGDTVDAVPTADDPPLISEDIDINDFLPKPPKPPDSKQVDGALQEIGSHLPEAPLSLQPVDYDFSAPFSPLEDMTATAQPRPQWGPAVLPDIPPHLPSLSHIPHDVPQVQETLPTARPPSHVSQSSFPLGQYTPEVALHAPKASSHGHPSHSSLQLQDGSDAKTGTEEPEAVEAALEPEHRLNQDGTNPVDMVTAGTVVGEVPPPGAPSQRSDVKVGELVSLVDAPDVRAHSSDSRIKVGGYVSELADHFPTTSAHGHSSDANLKVGGFQSDAELASPRWSEHGHASDCVLQAGCVVSGAQPPSAPLPGSVHGHSSDSTLGGGCVVAGAEPRFTPLPGSEYGQSSDSTLGGGCVVSGAGPVQSPIPGSVYGHSSDSTLGGGCVVSGAGPVQSPIPGSVYGHSSDSTLGGGCVVSGAGPLQLPMSGSVYGHSSDSTLGSGCVVSGAGPVQSPIPGSVYGHSSDSTLGGGCLVSGAGPVQSPIPGSEYGHSSDSTLGGGCVVSGAGPVQSPIPGSEYGHSSDSTLGGGCVVSGAGPLQLPMPGSVYGHSSDSTLGGGCVVSGAVPVQSPIPCSVYGHSSDSTLVGGCVVKDSGDKPRLQDNQDNQAPKAGSPRGNQQDLADSLGLWAASLGLSPGESSEQEYLLSLAAYYQVEHYEDCYNLMSSSPECQLLKQVTQGPWSFLVDPALHRATDTTAVQLSEMVSLPVLMKHSVTTPLTTHVSLVNKAVMDYFFVDLRVERHFEALRHFLLMEDGEFAQSLSDLLFEKLGSSQTPGELLTPLVLNSILGKALQYSLHGDCTLAANFTFALRFLPETFHPHVPDSLNCLELRYKVDWPLNIIITDSCMNKYNRLFSFLLQLKYMVWSLRDVWFHLKRTALVRGAGRSVQFRQLQLYRHEMQHFVKVIQGYIANQILQVSWSEFTAKLCTACDLDAIHRTHSDYLNRAIFRGLLTEKAAPVMNIIHSIFSLILKFRAQLIAQPWDNQQGEAVHPSFIAMQQSYNTFKYYSHFLFKVVTKLVNRGYQPHLEDFLLRINFNNYYKDS